MIVITVLAVGKLKEKYLAEGCRDYLKRLSRFARIQLVELPDRPAPQKYSSAQVRRVVEQEGRDILTRIEARDEVVALAIEGKTMDSVAFSRMLETRMVEGASRMVFVIGGSNGLSEEVLARADLQISFSPMTFSHGVFRIVLLEQLYRAFKIMNHETYHK